MGNTKVCPIRSFSLSRSHLTPSDKKFGRASLWVIRVKSLRPLNPKSKWEILQSMSHPPFFVSEPNLTPSDKKLGCAALNVCVRFVKSLGLLE